MSHQCSITISNVQNPYPLVLKSVSGPDGTGNPEGNFSPGTVQPGLTVGSGDTFSFQLKSDLFFTAGATLVWSTGSAGNSTEALITMSFENKTDILVPKNNAKISVAPAGNAQAAQLAYGVSYFYASSGADSPMSRDYINPASGDTPVYVDFTVSYNTYADTPPATPFLPGITNVVMLMMENRSLDQLLGQLYPIYDPAHVYPAGSPEYYNGFGPDPDFSNTANGNTVTAFPVTGTTDVPDPDPGEQWNHINQQLFNIAPTADNPYSKPPEGAVPDMGGFLASYIGLGTEKKPTPNPDQIMQFYTPANLPVLSTLAMSYAVSDAWFCSVPSQTSPNRVFSLSGTSSGYVDNYSKPGSDPLDIVRFGQRSIFNLLSDSGNNDWCIYWQKHLLQPIPLTAEIMKQVDELTKAQPANRQPVTEFFNTIANGGTLPAFSFLEPVFMPEHDIPASDYHPPYNIYPGEQYLADVYNALTTYKDWNTTLFIVTFDEHGGTMDHVPPPSTIAPDAMTDWSEFTFNRLGVRIPTLLISPKIQGGTVFRSPDNAVPFDHTSFVRTLLGWQNIDISGGAMGKRAVQAPDFSGVLSSSVVNPGQISLSPLSCTAVPDEIPMNDLQRFMLPMIVRELTENSPEIYYEVLSQLMEMQTVTEVRTFAEKLIGGK